MSRQHGPDDPERDVHRGPIVGPRLIRIDRCALVPGATTIEGKMTEPTKSRWYEIRVRGVLSDTLLEAFPGLRARTERGETVLSGELADRAALHGVLAEVEALGLELLEVRSGAG